MHVDQHDPADTDDKSLVVVMLVPGGADHAGGIGRWAGYLLDTWHQRAMTPQIQLVDTRGFGGWHVGAWRFGATLAHLLQLRATGRLGVIHANLSANGSTLRKCIVSILARMLHVPLVLHLHSGRYFDFYARLPRLAQRAVRRMFRRAQQIIVLGDGWADRVAATFAIPRNAILVMPNGAHDPATADNPPRQRTVPHVLFLGRLGTAKGVPELIEALGKPQLAQLDWQATLAGDGDPAAYLAQAQRLGLSRRVTFPGWLDRSAVDALLRAADLLVLPSRQENLPVCVVEALAHRVAVIATPVGALPELLKDGLSVRFVPIGDVAVLAQAIAELLGNPTQRESIAAAGHDVFLAKLNIATQAAQLRRLYRHLMRQVPLPPETMRPGGRQHPPRDLVSVIIPTHRRAALVCRAVASAFAQTWPAVEVIVIIDGPDPATHAALATMADPRLTVLRNDHPQGPGAARNTAAQVARGAWLAFLDDDDEWLPEKLLRQLDGVSPEQPVVLSCRCRVVTPQATYLWPRRLPGPHEPIDAYLFQRRSAWRGEAYLATASLVMPAWLFRRSGFGTTWQYEDTTLLLRATRLAQATMIVRPEPLAVIHIGGAGQSLGNDFPWKIGLDWLDQEGELFTPRGYSGFCLVNLGSQAARVRAWGAVPTLLRRAWRHGAPTPLQLLLFVTFWVVPQRARQTLRGLWARISRSATLEPPHPSRRNTR